MDKQQARHLAQQAQGTPPQAAAAPVGATVGHARSKVRGRIVGATLRELLLLELGGDQVAIQEAVEHIQSHHRPAPVVQAAKPESTMGAAEAHNFRLDICWYKGHYGKPWGQVPRSYICTLADLGLRLQRYLRSPQGLAHPEEPE